MRIRKRLNLLVIVISLVFIAGSALAYTSGWISAEDVPMLEFTDIRVVGDGGTVGQAVTQSGTTVVPFELDFTGGNREATFELTVINVSNVDVKVDEDAMDAFISDWLSVVDIQSPGVLAPDDSSELRFTVRLNQLALQAHYLEIENYFLSFRFDILFEPEPAPNQNGGGNGGGGNVGGGGTPGAGTPSIGDNFVPTTDIPEVPSFQPDIPDTQQDVLDAYETPQGLLVPVPMVGIPLGYMAYFAESAGPPMGEEPDLIAIADGAIPLVTMDFDDDLLAIDLPAIPLEVMDFFATDDQGLRWWMFLPLLLIPFFLFHKRKVAVVFHTGIDKEPYYMYILRGKRANIPEAIKKEGTEAVWYLSKKMEEKSLWDFNKRVLLRKKLYAKWPDGNTINPTE